MQETRGMVMLHVLGGPSHVEQWDTNTAEGKHVESQEVEAPGLVAKHCLPHQCVAQPAYNICI